MNVIVTRASILVVALAGVAVGQTKVDWINQVGAKPFLDSRQYNFTRNGTTQLITPFPSTIILSPCPLGVNGNSGHQYFRIVGSQSETVLALSGTNCASSPTSGTFIVIPAHSHAIGTYTVTSATAGIGEALTAGPAEIRIPYSGTIYAPIYVACGGNRIVGHGEHSSVFSVSTDFNLSALGVFVLQGGCNAGNVNYAQLENFTVKFTQPDSLVYSDYTEWPPAVYAQAAAYYRLFHFDTDLAWVSLDARNNGAAGTVEDCWISGFGIGIRLDGAGDMVRLHNVHNITGYSATSNQVQTFYAHAVGVTNGLSTPGATVEITNFLSLANIVFKQNDGSVYCTNCGFDTNNGLLMTGGEMHVSNSYFSTIPGDYAVNQTGGSLFIDNSFFLHGGTVPAVTFTSGVGINARLSITNSFFNLGSHDIQAVAISNGSVVLANNTIAAASVSTNPIISLAGAGNGRTTSITGNMVYPTSGKFIDMTTTGAFDSIKDNVLSGATITLPAGADHYLLGTDQGSVTFAKLPATPITGQMLYCSDCTVASPCANSGSGAFAKRLSGSWVCN